MEKFSDIRAFAWNDNSQHDVDDEKLLRTLIFNSSTKFTKPELPKAILEKGKEPPLGIRALQSQGITGQGVTVAIIDQPLALDHPEYKDRIIDYRFFAPKKIQSEEECISSMHGPSVASLLVGKNCGVAPAARVLYAAAPSWLGDSHYEAAALRWIIEYNKTVPEEDKVRLVSVSAAPSGIGSPRNKHLKEWDKAVAAASRAGMLVVDCTNTYGFVSAGYVDEETGEFKKGFTNSSPKDSYRTDRVYVPTCLRTTAESYDNKTFTYAYWGVGGLSWGIPYAVGVLALGQQINPKISPFKLKEILIDTADDCVINPIKFIERVRELSNEEESEG